MFTGHLCLVLQSSGNLMLGGLKNCTDCKDFCLSVLQKFFLSVTLFSITTIQVSLMCRRSVDFHEPIYHRLLQRNDDDDDNNDKGEDDTDNIFSSIGSDYGVSLQLGVEPVSYTHLTLPTKRIV